MDLRSRSLRHNSAKKATTTQDLSTADDLKSDDEDYLSTEESTSSRSTTSPEDDTSILGQEEAAIVNIGSTPAGISPALTPALAPDEVSAQDVSKNESVDSSANLLQSGSDDTITPDYYILNQDLSKQLLNLRRHYKKLISNQDRIKSHLDFLNVCQQEGKTPVGLKLNKTCNALKSDSTKVVADFNAIINKAQNDLVLCLIDHYTQVLSELEYIVSDVSNEIRFVSEHPTTAQAIATEHTESMKKTEANLGQAKARIAAKKQKKLSELRDPTKRKPKPPIQKKAADRHLF